MKKTTQQLALLPLSIAIAATLTSATAHSQSSVSLEEIVVTATKRETTLQETPVAVSVVTGDTLQKARMNDIADLQSVIPSLRVTTLQTSTNTNFVIRGFGNGANNPGIESSVGMFVDGVYRSRSAARISDLPKLDRVEVLRGPQSTLFGKNASAGVVNVVSAKPQFDQEGYLEVGVGNYNETTAKAYYTNGFNDSAAFSLGGNINQRDGYNEAVVDGLDDVNDRNRGSVQAQLLFAPSDGTSVRIIADYAKIDEVCCGITNIQNQGSAGAIMAMGGMLPDENDAFSYKSYLGYNPKNIVQDKGISLNVDMKMGNHTLTSITAMRNNESEIDFDADFNTLPIINTANDTEVDTFTQELRITSDYDGAVQWMLGGLYFSDDVTFNESVTWEAATRNYIDALAGGPALLATIEATNGFAPGTFFGAGDGATEKWSLSNEAVSIYGTVDFEVNDKLTLTAGLNYTDDEKTVTGSQTHMDPYFLLDLTQAAGTDLLANGAIAAAWGNPADPLYQAFLANFGAPLNQANQTAIASGAFGPAAQAGYLQGFFAQVQGGVIAGAQGLQFVPPMLGLPNGVEDGMTADDKLTYTLRASFEISDNYSMYASAATGFKASSWNLSRASAPLHSDGAALQAAGLLPPNYIYNSDPSMSKNFGTRYASPEESTVYELGLKAQFERGAFNVAIFDQSIEGFQSNLFQGNGFVLANAGEQSTFGVEFDGMFAVTEDLVVTGAVTYLDPKFDSFPGAPGPDNTVVDLTGTTPAGIPEWASSLSATYSFCLAGVDSYVRANWQYESEVNLVDNIPSVTGPFQPVREINSVNASFGMEWDNGLQMTLWGKNLFNDEYLQSAFPGVLQPGVVGAYTNQPRTYGIQVRKNF